jgi:hypothetical protein
MSHEELGISSQEQDAMEKEVLEDLIEEQGPSALDNPVIVSRVIELANPDPEIVAKIQANAAEIAHMHGISMEEALRRFAEKIINRWQRERNK